MATLCRLENGLLDLFENLRIVFEELLCRFTSLSDLGIFIIKPSTSFADNVSGNCQFEDIASLLMPSLNMMSNSASLNGGAILF